MTGFSKYVRFLFFAGLFFVFLSLPLTAQGADSSAAQTVGSGNTALAVNAPGQVKGSPINVAALGVIIVILGGAAVFSYIRFKNAQVQLRKERDALKESQEKYRLLVENAGDGILIIQNFKFKYANSQIYEIMGLKKEDSVSMNLVDYIHPDDLDMALEKYERNIRQNQEGNDYKIRLVKDDDTVIWVHIRSVPIIWEGEPASLAFIREITRQKQLEKDLQLAQRMEAIGTLAGGIAHDFNNILTTITGSAELALMDISDDDSGKEEFEQILESGYRAKELVRQILTVSRQHSQDIQPLFLNPIIKEALKLLRSTLPSNIKITEEINPEVSMVKGDSTQVFQVFMNLCTNANHAMEKFDTGELTIGLRDVTLDESIFDDVLNFKPGRYVELIVKDNGEGMDSEIQKMIFDPYFTTKEKGTGTGLGLATTMGIVKSHLGYIKVDSEKGDGSAFYVYLPVFEESEMDDEDLQAEPVPGKGRILFVDDERQILQIAQRMLGNLGYSVVTAGSGSEALEYLKLEPGSYDLLITDMAMPKMTGARLVKEVMKIVPDFPVILCTGHSGKMDEEKAKKLGVKQFLTKPYKLADLSSAISKYIGTRETA